MLEVTNVEVIHKQSTFNQPISLKVTIKCTQVPVNPITWKLIYIGSAKNQQKDQVLEQFDIQFNNIGIVYFYIKASPPNPELIPFSELLKLTAIILSADYQQQQFFRIGYYVHYIQPLLSKQATLKDVDLTKVKRQIISQQPRITCYQIQWSQSSEKFSSKESTNEAHSMTSSKFLE